MPTKNTISTFINKKKNNEKITMLTAYDYSTAKIIDQCDIDAILVGDSLGMVVLGYEDTTCVTMEDMIHHTKAVVRSAKQALVISDMPFLSYHISRSESVKNAGRLISEGGSKAVKLEGGEEIIESVRAIINSGIPVMGHLGYIPQSVNKFGGPKAQGKTLDTAERILKDALLLQEAGVFAVVLECIPYKLAQFISEKLDIPTIGIGAGNKCDGQILVTPDLLGLYEDFTPKLAKKYVNLAEIIKNAVKSYISEVKGQIFPTEKNSFIIEDNILQELKNNVKDK